MQRVVSFYEKLPRGPAPERQVSGPFSWYKKKYFGKNPSAARMFLHAMEAFILVKRSSLTTNAAIAHVIGTLMVIGYAQNYYFHLRKLPLNICLSASNS